MLRSLNRSCHVNLDAFATPWRKVYIFWNFQSPACKSRVEKIRYLQLSLLYLTSRVQWETSDKECNSTFCCPKIACDNCPVHRPRPVLLDKVDLLQLVQKNLCWLNPWCWAKDIFFWSTINQSTLTSGH